jgi:hypothetical protein
VKDPSTPFLKRGLWHFFLDFFCPPAALKAAGFLQKKFTLIKSSDIGLSLGGEIFGHELKQMTMKNQEIIEWAPFTLKEGFDEERLIEASNALQKDFLAAQPGYVSRELLKISDRQYVDMVRWESKELAEKAMTHAMESPACALYFQLMEMENIENPENGVTHLEVAATYH